MSGCFFGDTVYILSNVRVGGPVGLACIFITLSVVVLCCKWCSQQLLLRCWFLQWVERCYVSCAVDCFMNVSTTSTTSSDVISDSSTFAAMPATKASGRRMHCASTPATRRCMMKTCGFSGRGKRQRWGSAVKSGLRWVSVKVVGLTLSMLLTQRRLTAMLGSCRRAPVNPRWWTRRRHLIQLLSYIPHI